MKKLELAKTNGCFSMQDCIDGIISLCFSQINDDESIYYNGEPLKFDFGEKLAYLRAKRKMVRFYKKANENQLIATRKSMADFETRMARELDKHENVLNKVDEAIGKMLSE